MLVVHLSRPKLYRKDDSDAMCRQQFVNHFPNGTEHRPEYFHHQAGMPQVWQPVHEEGRLKTISKMSLT